MSKVIITVAPTGGFHGKEAHPNLPTQPKEIADAVYEAWNEGAAVVHIHARDPKDLPTNDPAVYGDIAQRIKEKCDIITQFSTGIGFSANLSAEEKMKPLEYKSEMATLTMGNLWTTWEGKGKVALMTRPELEECAKLMSAKKLKPELEIFNPSMLVEVKNLVDNGVLVDPYVSFVMGMKHMQGGMPFTPNILMNYLDLKNELLGPNVMFNVIGIGPAQWPAICMSTILGGNVRVGFEDNLYISKGLLAKNNAEMVKNAVTIVRSLGLEIATPNEARAILNLA